MPNTEPNTDDKDTAESQAAARAAAGCPGEIIESETEYHCDACGWCDEPEADGTCYNCGA